MAQRAAQCLWHFAGGILLFVAVSAAMPQQLLPVQLNQNGNFAAFENLKDQGSLSTSTTYHHIEERGVHDRLRTLGIGDTSSTIYDPTTEKTVTIKPRTGKKPYVTQKTEEGSSSIPPMIPTQEQMIGLSPSSTNATSDETFLPGKETESTGVPDLYVQPLDFSEQQVTQTSKSSHPYSSTTTNGIWQTPTATSQITKDETPHPESKQDYHLALWGAGSLVVFLILAGLLFCGLKRLLQIQGREDDRMSHSNSQRVVYKPVSHKDVAI